MAAKDQKQGSLEPIVGEHMRRVRGWGAAWWIGTLAVQDQVCFWIPNSRVNILEPMHITPGAVKAETAVGPGWLDTQSSWKVSFW